MLVQSLSVIPSGPPVFVDNGGILQLRNVTSFSPEFPPLIEPEDIAILSVIILDTLSSPGSQVATAPAPWNLIHAVPRTTIPGLVSAYAMEYWLRCDGTESGPVLVTLSETNEAGGVANGVISVWRNCVATGTPVESASAGVEGSIGLQTTPSIDTNGSNRKILAHFASASGGAPASAAVDPAEELYVAQISDTGVKCNFAGYSRDADTAGSYSISRTVVPNEGDMSVIFALKGN
jgi:hypothetical protein